MFSIKKYRSSFCFEVLQNERALKGGQEANESRCPQNVRLADLIGEEKGEAEEGADIAAPLPGELKKKFFFLKF